MRKGFALECATRPIRRAAGLRPLPYASMHKAFSLENSFAAFRRALPYASMRKGFALEYEKFVCNPVNPVNPVKQSQHRNPVNLKNLVNPVKTNPYL